MAAQLGTGDANLRPRAYAVSIVAVCDTPGKRPVGDFGQIPPAVFIGRPDSGGFRFPGGMGLPQRHFVRLELKQQNPDCHAGDQR